jgi:hypothetical protein
MFDGEIRRRKIASLIFFIDKEKWRVAAIRSQGKGVSVFDFFLKMVEAHLYLL